MKVKKFTSVRVPGAATIHEVENILGTKSWTRLWCDECGKDDCYTVFEVGEEPSCESRTASLCLDCVKELMEMAELEVRCRFR